ncbi:hypothetical protein [Aliikangiella coralliicola]|uniref:Uncharacterized protein n=1 Tax=Aliikangiella coralliicola TaxID=2592383 RepID=A0A545U0K9_9GAMM|nr:hypothetical protein [Aliikangiella coralliicola]TQV82943.1 hypothetical protein FLL46_24545 [Aliikangiella coralliicola]
MDKTYIDENDIVAKYLRGQLTPEETIDFETYLIDKPELVELVEMDSVLYKALPEVKTKNKKNHIGRETRWFGVFSPFSGLAAVLIVFVGFQLFFFDVFDSNRVRNMEISIGDIEFPESSYESTRGVSDSGIITSIPISNDKKFIALAVETGSFEISKFDVVIRERAEMKIIKKRSSVSLGRTGYFSVIIPTVLVENADYVLEVYEANSSTILESYTFRFERE